MKALSTTSMVAIETVSEAKASERDRLGAIPARRTERIVGPWPKQKARTTEFAARDRDQPLLRPAHRLLAAGRALRGRQARYRRRMVTRPAPAAAGEIVRSWRQRRKLSQFELSLQAAISSRHLSFVETGRARPSREMLLHLSERLEMPLRERNGLLLAAGYAPLYGERSLELSFVVASERAR
jgi:hypothetical protein